MTAVLPPLLWRAGLRHLGRHPWQLLLALVGLALGVAVVVAVDLTNASARRGFELSMEQLTGKATHRIVGDRLAESLYTKLRLELGVRQAAPVVTGYGRLPQGGLVRIMGLDAFAEGPFRGYLGPNREGGADLLALLTEPATALAPGDLVKEGRLTLTIGQRQVTLRAVGIVEDPALERLVVTDIATAQWLLDQIGLLDHIDLIIEPNRSGRDLLEAIRRQLPPGVRLESIAATQDASAQMTASFRLNLTAMSLLALVVGMFLIHNTMTFSVIQRRGLIGMLRALGVTQGEIFALILFEALLLGLVGTLLGLGLGILLATLLVDLVTQTINDLYYVLTVREFRLAPLSLVKALALGLVASTLAAWLPAREAAGALPGSAISRAHLELRWRLALPRLLTVALSLLGSGALLLASTRGLLSGFAGIFLMILGCALLTPGWILVLARLAQALAIRSKGLLIRMAARDLERQLSRTGVAAAALMVAFAATVGVGVMVDSFRGGVRIWIEDLLTADLYIAPPGFEDGG
ncbi:MAG: FtsX-like permease family protein, partial [Candidatus Competibacteraceae bacterium]|nr:FtsX-like permease family protein [Candidatus Competibacteraceae bacterium]